MQFKTNENLPAEIAEMLRQAGYNALTVFDQKLSGSADSELISICKSEERTLITMDTGFANIRNYPPEELHGLLVLRLRRQDKVHVMEVFERLLPFLSTESIVGNLCIVEEDRIRIWK